MKLSGELSNAVRSFGRSKGHSRYRKASIVAAIYISCATRLAFAAAGPIETFIEPHPADAKKSELIALGPTPVTEWLPPDRGGCKQRQRCNGSRRAPRPEGKAAELATALGVGTLDVAGRMLTGAPSPNLVAWLGDGAATGSGQTRALPHFAWPVQSGRFGRGLGFVRRHRRDLPHEGVDIVADQGSAIRAAADGLVVYADNGIPGYGNAVMLLHGDGTVTFYAHCRSMLTFPGKWVERGQAIATVGTTGISRGPHLHFEWRRNGRPLDPMRAFRAPRSR